MRSVDEKESIEQEKRLKERMTEVRRTLIVMSGKGGVGKTTVAVNLAYGLAAKANKIGILDIDIHGPNIAKMLGIEGEKLAGSELGIEPVRVLPNLKAVSLAFLLEDKDQPIIWRGPMKAAIIKQFLSDVNWGELDYLIVDSPPGTGDEPLSACQLISNVSGAIIVTTPQQVAVMDARKTIKFAKELKIPVVGVIENMSGFTCPHCNREIDIFKRAGGEKAAAELEVPFLGRVPFDAELVEMADEGKPFVFFSRHTQAADAFLKIVANIEDFMKCN